MKKIIILLSLLVLMTTLVMAQEEPTAVLDIPYATYADAQFESHCYEVGTEIYCIRRNHNQIWRFDTDAGDVINTTNVYPYPLDSELTNCHYTNNKVYCNGRQQGVGRKHFKMDLDGSNVVNLSIIPDSLTYGYDCQKRPSYDEMWCFGGWDNTYEDKLYKYDITGDSMTLISTQGSGDTDYGLYANTKCTWRDSSEFYCYGGFSDLEASNYLMKYVPATNTSTFTQNPLGTPDELNWSGKTGHKIQFIDDILYIFAGETYTDYVGSIFYYDPVGNTFGELDTTISTTAFFGFAYLDGVAYIIGGQVDVDDYSTLTWESQVPSEPVEAAVAEDDENIGGNIIALQNLQKAQRQAQQIQPLNPIEQLLLNLRAFILRLFGHEV